ncbi:MAG: hypothetical protein FWC93_05905 [Defluviitaleaceae bacterium]|nr:hypothetical protein [Defluviitaleaceae bacterium]
MLNDRSDNQILRRHEALVTFATAPASIKENIFMVTSTMQAIHSQRDQVVNNVSFTSGKLATFEPEFWRLDGSFMLPVDNNVSRLEVGFVSGVMSTIRGDFSESPEITVHFSTPQDLPMVMVMFDQATGEVAEEVRIRAVHSNGSVLLDETIRGNRELC